MTRPSRSDVYVWLVTAGLATTALACGGAVPQLPELEPSLWWPLLVALFALTERYVVHIPFGRDNQSLSFIEAPLLLGLLFATTEELVFAGLLGIGLALTLLLRSPPIKVAFNLSLWLAQSTVAIFVFVGMLRLLGTESEPLAPAGWFAALVATQAAHVLSGLAVAAVIAIRLHSWDSRAVFTGLARGADRHHRRHRPRTDHRAGAAARADGAGAARRHRRLLSVAALPGLPRAAAALRPARAALRVHPVGRRVAARRDGASRPSSPRPHLLRAQQVHDLLALDEDDSLGLVAAAWTAACCDSPRGRQAKRPTPCSGTGHIDAMAAPLRDGGRVTGVLLVMDRLDNVSTFDREDARLFEALAGHASVALANAGWSSGSAVPPQQTEHLSLHDHLTGLPNRLHFQQRLEKTSAGHRLGGRAADGPRPLQGGQRHARPRRRRPAARPGRSAAAAPRARGDDGRAARRRRVRRAARPMTTCMSKAWCSGSAATSAARSTSATSTSTSAPASASPSPRRTASSAALLLRRAEVAMYDAKRHLAGVAHYASDRDPYSARRLSLISDLARALEDAHAGACTTSRRPSPNTGRVTGVEALLRWRHPIWGNVPPDEFIPLAEHTGLIRPLTRFVIETAIHQCAAWRDAGTPVQMAVNVSMRNLLEPELADVVARLLVRANLPASLLKLEVTESAIVSDPERAVPPWSAWSTWACRISVDDFGTGYSSLTRLRNLPVHEVKIDRAFVRYVADSTEDLAIVRAVISLGHDLGLRVVAEGVEDEGAWGVLAGSAATCSRATCSPGRWPPRR